MGCYTRPDSPVWWLYLEPTQEKVRTTIRVGTTSAQKKDSRQLAADLYHKQLNELSARLYRLPSAQPAIRFAKYADAYALDTIPHHKGHEREHGLLKPLRAFFVDDLLTAIDPDRVKTYHTHRRVIVDGRAQASARTVNREVDLLKAMLRDAVPKYLTASPIKGMARLRIVKPKRRLLTVDEETKLLAHASPTETALLVLGIDGLIRQQDLLNLKRTDRDGLWLYIADPKGGDPYDVVLTDRAAAALDALPDLGPYYFHQYRHTQTARDRRSCVRRVLKALCARADVLYGKKAGGVTFHWATRKTGTTRLIERGTPIPAVQRQGNWKTADVLLSIYAEANREAQTVAIRGKVPKKKRA